MGGGFIQFRLRLDGPLLFLERVEVPSHDGAFVKVPGRFFKLPNQVCVPPVLTRLIQGMLAADELLLNVLNFKRLHGLKVVFVVGVQQVVLLVLVAPVAPVFAPQKGPPFLGLDVFCW